MLTTDQARKLRDKLDYYVPDESMVKGMYLRTNMHEFVEDYIFLKKYYEEHKSKQLDSLVKVISEPIEVPDESTSDGKGIYSDDEGISSSPLIFAHFI